MPKFSDYHRTVIGYHGTRKSVAEKIVLRQEQFTWQDHLGDWMGSGIYFWEYSPKQAWWWAELRRRQKKWTEPVAVVVSMIRLGFCFDLLDPDNARDLKSFHKDFVESQTALGLEVPANARKDKYLDRAVFEYAYKSIEDENQRSGEKFKVDTCRGVYVRPGSAGRLWKGSWVEHDAFIQLIVRNPDCILGSWLAEPAGDESDVEESPSEIQFHGDTNFEGGGSLAQDDALGTIENHGEGGGGDTGAG